MSLRTQNTMHFTLLSKNVLSPEEQELYELADLAGVVIDPSVFKIVLDLLKMNVAPTAVLQMLKSMCGQRRKKAQTVGGDHHPTPDPSAHLPARFRDDSKPQHPTHRVRSGSHGRTVASSRSDPRK